MTPYRLVEEDIQIAAELELGRRLRFSCLSHIALFSVVLFSTPLSQNHFPLTVVVGSGQLLFGLLRFWLSLNQKKFYPERRRAWLALFDVSLIAVATLWGILCAEVLRHYGVVHPMASIILLITAGLTAGASNSLNPSFERAVVFIGITIGIPFAFLLWSTDEIPLSGAFAVIFVIYFTFLSMQARSQYEIFRNLLRTQKEIIDLNRSLDENVRERTERLFAAEAKLIESAKMAALGEMAAGIAHEVNTPLATIGLLAEQTSELAEEEKVDRSAIGERMQTIGTTVSRIAGIVDGLLTFSRHGGSDEFNAVPVRRIVDDTLALCRQKIQAIAIDVRQGPIDDGLLVRCRSVQISQVLLNLISNSCDAVSVLPEKWIEISARRGDDGIEIHVTDSGAGIPESIRTKLFQPFFTTKEIGKGTGLGLSISQGIVESHHGKLLLDLESRHTRFVLHLPEPSLDGRQPRSRTA